MVYIKRFAALCLSYIATLASIIVTLLGPCALLLPVTTIPFIRNTAATPAGITFPSHVGTLAFILTFLRTKDMFVYFGQSPFKDLATNLARNLWACSAPRARSRGHTFQTTIFPGRLLPRIVFKHLFTIFAGFLNYLHNEYYNR